MRVTEFAPAKINLALHVIGQRHDGFHLLDSLVAFASIGDMLQAEVADAVSLALEGPFGADISPDADNLVLRAARAVEPDCAMAFILQKNLPPASGIGGGSADAAAAIRAVGRLKRRQKPDVTGRDENLALYAALGADVPVCVLSQPARMRGIGEQVSVLPSFPGASVVLINPRVEVPTPAVFRALQTKDNPPLPETLPDWPDPLALADWLMHQRNDLQTPALGIAPVIGRVLNDLAVQPGVLLARMSGSGATCFGLFADAASATEAVRRLGADRPQWWVAGGTLSPRTPT